MNVKFKILSLLSCKAGHPLHFETNPNSPTFKMAEKFGTHGSVKSRDAPIPILTGSIPVLESESVGTDWNRNWNRLEPAESESESVGTGLESEEPIGN